MLNINIPKCFEGNDSLYHYTNHTAAIENILYYKRLRLSPRKRSIDPVESVEPIISFHRVGDKENTKNSYPIYTDVKKKNENAKQICFCKNSKKKNEYITEWECYGFLKPRMWDQYAENYKGLFMLFIT